LDIFGSFALLLAFLAAVYAFGASIAGIVTQRAILTKSARNAGMAVFGLVTLAVASPEYLFFTDNFSMAYVAAHSNRALPALYKFAALWARQEGSLLWWSWLLSVYAFFALFLNRKKHPELMPYAGVTLAGVQICFLTLNNFVVSPFKVLGGTGAAGLLHVARLSEGSGLNPLLQYSEMVIHPPMLNALLRTGYSSAGFARRRRSVVVLVSKCQVHIATPRHHSNTKTSPILAVGPDLAILH
jgi:cytochrome c-type biogenesis protein CcmF